MEDLSNQYDAAELHLSGVQAQVAKAKAGLAGDEATEGRIRGAVTDEAVSEYTSGGFQETPGNLTTAAVDPLVAQSYFEMATGNQTDALDQYKAAERVLADQQQSLKQAEKAAASAANALGNRRQAVSAAQSQAQATLSAVNGQIATLVAQAQAAAAAKLRAQQEAAYNAALARQRAQAAQAAQAQAAASAAASSSGLATSNTTDSTNSAVETPTTEGPSPATPSAPAQSPPTTSSPPTTAPPSVQPTTPVPGTGGAAAEAVSVALAQVGKPYQWGGGRTGHLRLLRPRHATPTRRPASACPTTPWPSGPTPPRSR